MTTTNEQSSRERSGEVWQPIATAPTDGSPVILGYMPNDDYPTGFVGQGRWVESDDDGPDNMGHDAGFVDDCYTFFHCGRSFGNPKYQGPGLQPTHWQPLPTATPSALPAQAVGEKIELKEPTTQTQWNRVYELIRYWAGRARTAEAELASTDRSALQVTDAMRKAFDDRNNSLEADERDGIIAAILAVAAPMPQAEPVLHAVARCEKVALESGAYESYRAVAEAFTALRAALSAPQEAGKVEPVAEYQRGWKDGNDTANRAHAALAASPMFWVRLLADGLYEGPLHYKSADLQECRDANPSEWHPLHLHPAPQALSDAKDVARYRHIRSMAPKRLRIVDIETNTSFMEEHADEAIDAAILAAAGGSEK